MADISKIKLPGEYGHRNVKDNAAVSSLSVSGSTITLTKRDGSTENVTFVSELTADEVRAMFNKS